MKKSGVAISSWLQRTTSVAAALLLLPLFLFSTVADAESPATAEPATDAQDVTELKIYKQRVKVTADVVCRVYERRPIFCTATVQLPITAALDPEVILKYSSFRIGDKEVQPETTPDHNIKFRADKVNYNGQQQVDVEVIYVK